jgi:heme/copper-type cytochrome/quinol oxidase subunit 3
MSETTSSGASSMGPPLEHEMFPTLTETPEELAYELRAAEGSLWTGTRLVIGIGIFFYASLAFAYFYLRSNNNENLWRPGNITAPTGTGAAIMAFALAAAALMVLAVRRLKASQTLDWQVAGWTAVLSTVIALGLQIWELTQLPFYPGAYGYSSCFIGWATINILTLLAGLYWSETLLARYMRLSRAHLEEGGMASSPLPVAQLFRANAEGCVAFWGFIVVAELFCWLIFYVI